MREGKVRRAAHSERGPPGDQRGVTGHRVRQKCLGGAVQPGERRRVPLAQALPAQAAT